jgi:DNA polymerase I-like protein with 3'-5' exonuclease and polymerase domains
LIKPTENNAVAYIDYEQQEFGIGAALSKDPNMMEAYLSGDPYLAFGKQAGAIPTDGTKETHKNERKQFKQAALGIQYGMGREALGISLGGSPAHGHKFIQLHRTTYPNYWRYVEAVQDKFFFHGSHTLSFGWRMQLAPKTRVTTVRNFAFQGNGAEMLRLAIILAVERGVKVCAPIHDALLIEAPVDKIEEAVTTCEQAMQEASELVLPGFPLRTEHVIVRYPERYMDEAGEDFWNKIWDMRFLRSAFEDLDCPGQLCPDHPGQLGPRTSDTAVRPDTVLYCTSLQRL